MVNAWKEPSLPTLPSESSDYELQDIYKRWQVWTILQMCNQQSHHLLQDALDVCLATQALVHTCFSKYNKVSSAARCTRRRLGHTRRRLVRLAVDDDFVI